MNANYRYDSWHAAVLVEQMNLHVACYHRDAVAIAHAELRCRAALMLYVEDLPAAANDEGGDAPRQA